MLIPSAVYCIIGTKNHSAQSAVTPAAASTARMRRFWASSFPALASAAIAQKSTQNIVLSRWLMHTPVMPSASSGHFFSSRRSTSYSPSITTGKKIIARLSPSVARVYTFTSR